MSDNYDQLAYRLRKYLAPYLLPFTEDNTGTYTPTYLGGTTPGATTYTTQQGAWVRLGPVVIATGIVAWTAATGTGTARIGLPFTSANVANQNFGGSIHITGVTFAAGTPLVVLAPNIDSFFLQSPATNVGSTNVAIEAAGQIIFTVTYFIG